jgi:hypothetical protein
MKPPYDGKSTYQNAASPQQLSTTAPTAIELKAVVALHAGAGVT